MSNASNSFVDLNRTFHELAKYARENDAYDVNQAFLVGSRLNWNEILEEYRVVILSEAGSGKTEEIRQAAYRLRAIKKNAFFLRLEHITTDFEDAFEVGTYDEFQNWLHSPEDAWFLLDSVDEARLRHPGDFERAIRKLGRNIQTASARARIILSGRTSVWRAKTDLDLCERHLSLPPGLVKASKTEDITEDVLDGEEDHHSLKREETRRSDDNSIFKIVALDDLTRLQVTVFAAARGVTDTSEFLDEIERSDADSFTNRPQDLQELIEFWNLKGRIGTRTELMQTSLRRRLEERDQNHREVQPLSSDRARDGARLLAAASILCKEPTIQVPDGSHNFSGIAIHTVLPDWDDREQQSLLSRPVFDEAIYGTVRFHHRSVREFLTAEWISKLLEKSTSRREIESLLFREQYGIEVIVPTLRPVLPWLAISDERIRERVLRIAPQVLFEGGDPNALPITMRKSMLKEACAEIASGRTFHSALNYTAVQRFSNEELSEDVRTLLITYASNEDVIAFLIRMIWLGRLHSLSAEAKALAVGSSTPHYTRIAAIRAVHEIGSSADHDDLRSAIANEVSEIDRDCLGEVVAASTPTSVTVEWLLQVVRRVVIKKKFAVDSLANEILKFVKRAEPGLLFKIVDGLNAVMGEAPYIERGYCDISQRHSWLLAPAAVAAERLISDRRPEALLEPTLSILHMFRTIRHWDDDVSDIKAEFSATVPAWDALNGASFWYDVEATRKSARFEASGNRVVSFWQAIGFGAYWEFGVDKFDEAIEFVRQRDEVDDKLVALSLAFSLYEKAGRPANWIAVLDEAVRGNAELEASLTSFKNPPVSEYAREERKWQKRAEKRKKKEDDNRLKSKVFIQSNIDLVRSPKFKSPSDISQAQWYLHEWLREKSEGRHSWTAGLWRDLIPEFGEEVAYAYREAVIEYWRRYQPLLRSEGAPTNSTPIYVIFGLTGLNIEASETEDWAARLPEADVILACRYAMYELNGFPHWFPRLFEAHRDTVAQFLLAEIEHEIISESPDQESHYLLSDASWSGQWMWDALAPHLLELTRTKEIRNSFNLSKTITILQGASVIADGDLAVVAEMKATSGLPLKAAAAWYAVWVGVNPELALPAVATYLSSINTASEQTEFAMTFITRLLGGRRSEKVGARPNFKTPHYLKELYLLILSYVRENEDLRRAGGGVYSPELRDDAQDARDSLFNMIKAIPGKASFVALSAIADLHPNAASKPWLAASAKAMAEADADLPAWTATQLRDFHEHLDRTPSTHRELADLAVMRLSDIKDDLENGDESVAKILQYVKEETEMRNYLAHELRAKAQGRYTITQEEELADAKRPDLRFHGAGFDRPVPAELKLAERWSGPKLFERFEAQLSGDYLRDNRSHRGIFALVNRKKGRSWQLPSGEIVTFAGLLTALRDHWSHIAAAYDQVEDISVIGIDLSMRFE